MGIPVDTKGALAEANTILRVVAGSQQTGTSLDTHDRDELGVCVEPPECVIGLRTFEQWVYRDAPKGERARAGDLEVTIYGLRKFMSLALKGNPTIVSLLFVPPHLCITRTDLGISLQELAPSLVAKNAGRAFLGYMRKQRERLNGERGQKNVQRPELVETYGYDTKYASQIIKLGLQGVELLTEGFLSLPMRDFERDEIIAVRKGEVPLVDVVERGHDLEEKIVRLLESSALPESPDYEKVNDWLVAAHMTHWGSIYLASAITREKGEAV